MTLDLETAKKMLPSVESGHLTDLAKVLDYLLGGGAPSGGVDSFDGRTGTVVPASGDYVASQVTDDSSVDGATVKDALDTLQDAINAISEGGAGETTTRLYVFSPRKIVGTSTSPIALRRADGTTITGAYTANSDTDTAAIITSLAGQTGYVSQWTNQVSGQVSFTNTTSPLDTNQPIYSPLALNGRPALSFTGLRYLFDDSATATSAGNYTMQFVVKPNSESGLQPIFLTRGSGASQELYISWRASDGRLGFLQNGTWQYTNVKPTAATMVLTFIFSAANGATILINGEVAATGLTFTSTPLYENMRMGVDFNGVGGNLLVGEAQIWSGAMGLALAQKEAIASMQYFGVASAPRLIQKTTAATGDFFLGVDGTTGKPVEVPYSGLPSGGGGSSVASGITNDSSVLGTTVKDALNTLGYYPEAHGAVGDGVTDDTTAMQAWLNYAKTNAVHLALKRGKTYRVTNILDATDQYGLLVSGGWSQILFDCYGAGSFGLFKVRQSTKAAATAFDGSAASANTLSQFISLSDMRITGPWRFGDSFLSYSSIAADPSGVLRSGGGNATFGRNLFIKSQSNEYNTGSATFTAGSTTVTGSGTAWLANVRAGDRIRPETSAVSGIVSSVTNDTTIVLTAGYTGTSTASVAYRVGGKPTYSTGRVASIPGTRRIYGWGTNFTTSGVQVGDPFWFNDRHRRYKVASIDSATQITLDRDFADAADQNIYNTGTVTATNGSTTMTGSGTAFIANMVGSVVEFVGESDYYTVASYTNATTLVLDRAYTGSTAAGKSYRVIHTRGFQAGKPTEVHRLYQYTLAGTNNRFVPFGTKSNVKLDPAAGGSGEYSYLRDVNFVGEVRQKISGTSSAIPVAVDDVVWNNAYTFLVVGGGIVDTAPTSNLNYYQVDKAVSKTNATVTNGSVTVTGTGFSTLPATGWVVFDNEYDFYGYTYVSNTEITLSKPYGSGTNRSTATARFGAVCYLCLGDAAAFGTDILGLGSCKNTFVERVVLRGGGDVGIKDSRTTAYPPESSLNFSLLGQQNIFVSRFVIEQCFSAHSMTPGGGNNLHFSDGEVSTHGSFKIANQSLSAGRVTISGLNIAVHGFSQGLELYSIQDLQGTGLNIKALYGGYAGIDVANNDSGSLSDMGGIHIPAANVDGFLHPFRLLALDGKKIKNCNLTVIASDYFSGGFVNSGAGVETIENCVVRVIGSSPRAGANACVFQNAPIKSCFFDFSRVEGANPVGTTNFSFVSGADDGKNTIIIPVDGVPVVPVAGTNIPGVKLVSRNPVALEPHELMCVTGGLPGVWEFRGGGAVALLPRNTYPSWAVNGVMINLFNHATDANGLYQRRAGVWTLIST